MYHTDYFFPVKSGVRECLSRRILIEDCLNGLEIEGDLLDIGIENGYYALSLSPLYSGVHVIEIEDKICNVFLQYINLNKKKNIHICNTDVIQYTQSNNSKFHTVLALSVFHHVIQQSGIEKATEAIKHLADHSEVMFFDAGMKEEPGAYKWKETVPDDWGEWLKQTGKNVEILGYSEVHKTKRPLFLIK